MKSAPRKDKGVPRKPSGRGRSKRVGGAYERTICKSLSLWVSNYKRKDVFWRSAMSGGRDTRVHAPSQAGDISAVHQLGHLLLSVFVIECKYRSVWPVESLMFNDKPKAVQDFRKQVGEAAKRLGRLPMMVMHPVRRRDMVIVTEEGWEIFDQSGIVPQLVIPRHDLYFVRYDHMVSIPYSRFKRGLQAWRQKQSAKEDILDELSARERL